MTDYTFHINAYKPETIPMERLAQYMYELARLLGHPTSVHFRTVSEGSVKLISRVDQVDRLKVEQHVESIREKNGAEIHRIDKLLADDNTSGSLIRDGAEVIQFPGVNKPKPRTYGPLTEIGTIDGVLVGVLGADRSKHIHLRVGAETWKHISTNDEELAKALGRCLYEPIRLKGVGTWVREEEGRWELKRFEVKEFDALRRETIGDAFNNLRQVEVSDWSKMEDALAELRRLRDEGGESH